MWTVLTLCPESSPFPSPSTKAPFLCLRLLTTYSCDLWGLSLVWGAILPGVAEDWQTEGSKGFTCLPQRTALKVRVVPQKPPAIRPKRGCIWASPRSVPSSTPSRFPALHRLFLNKSHAPKSGYDNAFICCTFSPPHWNKCPENRNLILSCSLPYSNCLGLGR